MIVLPITKMNGSFQTFLDKHSDLMYRYTVKQIAKAIKHNLAQVNLYRLGNTRYIATIRRHQYMTNVELALKYFVKTEEYEWAAKCLDLQKHIVINDLIYPIRCNNEKK